MKNGKIIPNGVILEQHEYRTVVFLTERGFDVELIPKSNKTGVHTPDIVIAGEKWEMKAPKGEEKYLIPNTIQKAIKQSRNIIIDLRRVRRDQTKCIYELKKEFNKSHSIKKLKIIIKSNEVLDFEK